MYKKIFIDLSAIAIFMGIFAYIMSTMLGLIKIPYLQEQTYFGQTMYTFDFVGYVRNLQNSFTDFSLMNLSLPEKQWRYDGSIANWEPFFNNLAVMLNWFLFLLNIIIYPVRFIGYIIKGTLAILGAPVTTIMYNGVIYEPQWFIVSCNTLCKLEIPYIQ